LTRGADLGAEPVKLVPKERKNGGGQLSRKPKSSQHSPSTKREGRGLLGGIKNPFRSKKKKNTQLEKLQGLQETPSSVTREEKKKKRGEPKEVCLHDPSKRRVYPKKPPLNGKI